MYPLDEGEKKRRAGQQKDEVIGNKPKVGQPFPVKAVG